MSPSETPGLSPILFIGAIIAAGTWVVVLSHIALLTRSQAKRYRQRWIDQRNDKITGNREKGEGDDHKSDSLSPDFSALIHAIQDQGRRSRDEGKREDNGRTFREGLTILLLCATLLAISWQVYEMIKVYGPISRQADILEAGNRGWVAATFMGLQNDYLPGRTNAALHIVNPGTSPALNVTWSDVKVILVPYVTPSNSSTGEGEPSENTTCTGLKPSGTTVLWPQTGVPDAKTFVPLLLDNSAEATIAINKAKRLEGSLFVQGCIVYLSQTVPHSTRYQFLWRDEADKPFRQWNFNVTARGNDVN